MYKLADLYQAVLGMMIRFFDNRFNLKENETAYLLKLELEKSQTENRKLVNSVLENLNSSRSEVSNESIAIPQPIGTASWKVKARKLEDDSRKRRQMINEVEIATKNTTGVNPEATRSIEALEDELGIGGIN